MPTFSIIVPVYNAETTLRKCLESIRSQTCQEYEVLMIENGSQDASNAICQEYASKDSRFVLHTCKENKGPSGARNIGLEHAKGEFVAFIDSDDFVEADYLKYLGDALKNADVVFFGYRQISTDGNLLGECIPNVPEKKDYHEMLLQLHKQNMFGYTWIKAFRREIIGQHRFSMELNLLEDEVFACEVLTEQRRLAIIPKALYNYVTGNTGSLVGRTHADYCRKVDVAYEAWKKLLYDYDKKDETLTRMADAHVNRCMYYGFERDVDVRKFFGLLADSDFFHNSTQNSKFKECVKSRNYKKLSHMRNAYRFKNKIAKLLRK